MAARTLADLGTPIEGAARSIKDGESLGLDFSITPQALAAIAEIEANARHALMRCRNIVLD